MPILLCLLLLSLGSVTLQAQGDPCHCLGFGIDIHDGATNLEWVPIASREQHGQQRHIYKAQNRSGLTAIVLIDHPPKESSPVLERLEWQASAQPSIAFQANWKFDLKTAYQARTAFAKKHHKSLADLHPFDFLPPMNSALQVQVYLVYGYEKDQWPIPKDNISMKAQITIPAHPFYSDINSQSPFKMRLPYLKVNLAHIPDHQWNVTINDGINITKELLPLE